MAQLLLASTNLGKVSEIQALLKDLNLELITPSELQIDLIVEESGASYEENASHKALAFAKRSGILTLADDSGLEVDILNGAPGLFSARFSPLPNATDADRRAHLISELETKPRPWRAHFHCTIVLALPSGEIYTFQGECPGEIIPEERGQNGFGYDPIFYMPEVGKTIAELTMEEKNQLSHRARAVRAAIPTIKKLLA